MKRIWALILMIAMTISVVGCSQKVSNNDVSETKTETGAEK